MEERAGQAGKLPGHPGLYVASGLMNFAGGMAMVALCYYAKAYLQASLMQLAFITLLGNIVYVSLCPVLGKLSDRYGRRRFIVISTLIFAGAYYGASLSTAVWQLYIVTAVSGVGHALFWPSVEAELAAEADSHQLRRRVGRFNISWSLGDIAGALVAGVGLELNPKLPFALCAATGVVISIFTSRLLVSEQTADSRARHQQTVNGHAVPGNHRTFWKMALFANLFSAGFISIIRRLFPDMAVEALHYSGLQWGFLVMVVALARTTVFIIMERYHGWIYRPKRFFLMQLLFPAGFLLILTAQSYWVFVLAFACIGSACGMVYFSSLYYSVHGAGSQAQQAGVHESVLGLGAGVIPFLAGPSRSLATAYWTGAIRAPYLLAVVLSLGAITAQVVTYLRSRGHSRPKDAPSSSMPGEARSACPDPDEMPRRSG